MAKKKTTKKKAAAKKTSVNSSRKSDAKAAKKKTKSTKKKAKGVIDTTEVIQIPVEHVFRDDISPTFSNSFAVRHEEGVFHLFFFNTRGPLIFTEDPKERKEIFDKIDSVKSQCLSHIAMTPQQAIKVLEALQVNIEKFMKGLPDAAVEALRAHK